MPLITKLTPAQEVLLPRFRDEWLAWGTCTDRADRPRAEAAIMALRRRIKVTNQPTFIWCQSPVTSALATHVLDAGKFRSLIDSLDVSCGYGKRTLRDGLMTSVQANLGGSLRDTLWGSLMGSLLQSVDDNVWGTFRESLGDSLCIRLRGSIREDLWSSSSGSLERVILDRLWESLWINLGATFRTSLTASLGAELKDHLNGLQETLQHVLADSWAGQQDAYWIAFYLFCRDVLKIKYGPKQSAILDLWRDLAQSCCWWQCYKNYVIISERPTVCRLDDRSVLHCQDGPALAFADGWSVHCWHGVRIPAAWIEDKESLTPEAALKEENVEKRRAACEILGWDRILKDLGAVTVQRDPDPSIGELLEVHLPGSGKELFLRVRCGTGRTFAIPVPPNVKTALEANAWSYGVDAGDYHPEIRT